MLGRHRLVDRAPVDRVLGRGIANDELVLDAATGELAGIDQQRAVLRQPALAALDRVLDQRRGREIPEDLGARRNTLRIKALGRNPVGHVVESPFPDVKNGGGRCWAMPPHTYALKGL